MCEVPLDFDMAKRFNTDRGEKITYVARGGAADRVGVLAGMNIVERGGKGEHRYMIVSTRYFETDPSVLTVIIKPGEALGASLAPDGNPAESNYKVDRVAVGG